MGLPITTGETLADVDHPVALESIVTPEPLVRIAIEPVTRDDRERLPIALARMIAADPSLHLESDPDTDQALLAGMGQLHLEITVDRLATEHDVRVTTGVPRVAYRSTVTRVARRELRHVKQSGGPGQFAVVTLEVGPAPRGAGLVFEDATRGGVIPRPFASAVEAGVRQAMGDGLLGGHPVADVRVTLVDGQTHPKDSSERAFHTAGALAFKAAAADAGPILLEPVMKLEVACDAEHLGDVIGDLGRRRAHVLGIDLRGDAQVVRAEIPLAESFGYAGSLAGLTSGRGRFVLEPARYEPVPEALAKVG
jgi:elongation factor G